MNERLRLLAWQIDFVAYERNSEGRFAGQEPKRAWRAPWPALARRTRAVIARVNFRLTPADARDTSSGVRRA